MRIAIVGAGGHAQVVADIIRATASVVSERLDIVALLDDNPALAGMTVAGSTVLGGLTLASCVSADAFVVAIGDNDARARAFRRLRAEGLAFLSVAHPSAIIGSDVRIGDGAMISAGAIVVTGSQIGCGAILNTGCTVDHHATIGDFVHIAPGVHIGGDVMVGDGALIGLGALVLPGRILGAGCTVGAGAVVTRDVAQGVTVLGVPARPMKDAVVPRPPGEAMSARWLGGT
jgi:sugar O-acyltransferase (sialic acid O-acetyltransferase NeuD family)